MPQLSSLMFHCRFLTQLYSSQWLHILSLLLAAANKTAVALERECRPVLVHCSDGWDRTPQITALAQLLLDPFYRTIEVSVSFSVHRSSEHVLCI